MSKTRRQVLEGALTLLQREASNGDLEVAHATADEILCGVVKNLATHPYAALTKQILDAYNAVGKWYA